MREKGLQKLWQIITLEMENSQTEVFNGEKEISARAAAVQWQEAQLSLWN